MKAIHTRLRLGTVDDKLIIAKPTEMEGGPTVRFTDSSLEQISAQSQREGKYFIVPICTIYQGYNKSNISGDTFTGPIVATIPRDAFEIARGISPKTTNVCILQRGLLITPNAYAFLQRTYAHLITPKQQPEA